MQNANSSLSFGAMKIWLYPDDSSMKDSASWPMVASFMILVKGNGNSSLEHTSLRYLKSIQIWICPFFFLRGTILDIHARYLTLWMNPTSMSLLKSFSISEIYIGQNFVEPIWYVQFLFWQENHGLPHTYTAWAFICNTMQIHP